ncbi:regulatory protein, MerR [Alloactinosynnema sp. L-07]|nr:regulatory protein, MerR [Alloactinosynnema sp. L-07]
MGIGDVARRFGLATHVLRHWETMGLLAPVRAEGARRHYSSADLYRVAAILHAKEAGFGLEDIRDMITTRDPTSRQKLLQRRRAELTRRIAKMQGSLELIDAALGCDHDDIARCPRLQTVLAERIGAEAPSAIRHDDAIPTVYDHIGTCAVRTGGASR